MVEPREEWIGPEVEEVGSGKDEVGPEVEKAELKGVIVRRCINPMITWMLGMTSLPSNQNVHLEFTLRAQF